MKKLKVLLITSCILILAGFFGACTITDVLIPTHISPIVRDYINDANDVPLPPYKPLFLYESLFDAKGVAMRIEFIHQYRGMKEELRHNFAKNINQFFIATGEKLGQQIFSSTGVLGMLLPTSMVGILAALGGGRYIKSPKEKELEKKVNGNNNS